MFTISIYGRLSPVLSVQFNEAITAWFKILGKTSKFFASVLALKKITLEERISASLLTHAISLAFAFAKDVFVKIYRTKDKIFSYVWPLDLLECFLTTLYSAEQKA